MLHAFANPSSNGALTHILYTNVREVRIRLENRCGALCLITVSRFQRHVDTDFIFLETDCELKGSRSKARTVPGPEPYSLQGARTVHPG